MNSYNHLYNSPGLEPVAGIALGSATVAPINMANAYATIANGGRAADVHVIDKVVDRNGETLWSYKQATKDADRARTSPRTPPTRCSRSSRAAPARRRWRWAAPPRARPAPRPTARTRCPRRGSSATPRSCPRPSCTSAGTGNEQLDGWLPSYFGADYPAHTWTDVMRRDMEGVPVEQFPPPALTRRHRAADRPRAVRAAGPDLVGAHAEPGADDQQADAVPLEEAVPRARPRARRLRRRPPRRRRRRRRPRRSPCPARRPRARAASRARAPPRATATATAVARPAVASPAVPAPARTSRPGFYDRRWGYSA